MQRVNFHSFTMGDVDDPEIYAAQPLSEFMSTEKGQWITEHCPDPLYRIGADASYMGHRVYVYGDLTDELATIYYLKWGYGDKT